MSSVGVPIPALDPPWSAAVKIAVVSSLDALPGWRRFAHEVAALAQKGGHSFPLEEQPPGRDDTEGERTAFLYRHADRVGGYLCLTSKIVTGYRELSAGYRHATDAERVMRPCIMIVWVDVRLRGCGVARQLVDEAARCTGVMPSGLAWAEPFTDSGFLLAQSIAPGGLWIADYS